MNVPNPVLASVAQLRRTGPFLSIVVPTFNESANIEEFLRRIEAVFDEVDWEVVFVDDDSPDGTAELVRAIAVTDARVRCVQRIGRRGLSTACVEGIQSTSAPFIAVMDADLQHDERILPEMLQRLYNEDLDIVVGSRYVKNGSVGDWQKSRATMSQFATKLSRLVIKSDLKDPMSGYFMMRRETFAKVSHRLSGIGFKILLDIFASSPEPLKFREVPFEFRARHAGESKLDSVAMVDYAMLLLDKLLGHRIPVRFVMFSAIGTIGLAIHFAVLASLFGMLHIAFDAAQATATFVAMTGNFFLNNSLTYRDKRLKGSRLVRGLLSFYAICGLGAAANVGAASYIFEHNYSWWLSGIAGVMVGVIWNYAATSLFTWRDPPAKNSGKPPSRPAVRVKPA